MKTGVQKYIIAACVVMLAASCAVTDIDRQYNFSQLTSYAWDSIKVTSDNPIYTGDLIEKHIKTTVNHEFAKRGVQYDASNPDFLVSVKSYAEEKERIRNSYGSYLPTWGFYSPFYGWRPFGWWPYGAAAPYQDDTYTEGTLIVEIKDKKSDEVVWRGMVSGNVDNVKKLQRQIQKGVEAIMKKAPVPSKQLNVDGDRPIS